MNDNFLIPDKSSLYNIKSIYNALIDELSQSGQKNLLSNPRMEENVRQSGVLAAAGWDGDPDLTSQPIVMSSGEKFGQDLKRLDPVTTYTVVMDAIIDGTMTMAVNGSVGSTVFDFVDGTSTPIQTLSPEYDAFLAAQRQQVAMTFTTGTYNENDAPRLEFTAEENTNIMVYGFAIIKGTFGFTAHGDKAIFMEYVRSAEDGTNSYYEASVDGGLNYYRVATAAPSDLHAIANSASAAGAWYSLTEMDSQFLRKDTADTAEELITFAKGLLSNDNLTIADLKQLVMQGGQMVVNNVQQSGTPLKEFRITVKRGNQPDVGIRYNESIDRWQFTHDGLDWKIFGSGTSGTTGGTGDSELEYYAEILDRSGYKYGIYDLFDNIDQVDGVLYTNMDYDADHTFYTPKDGLSPNILRTRNIWPSDASGAEVTFFVNVLTNKIDNSGVSIYYVEDSTGNPDPPTYDSTAWIAAAADGIVTPSGPLSQLYLKIVADATDVEIHSFGVFYGTWAYRYSTETRLREVTVLAADTTANELVTVPNLGAYTPDGESLEFYINRVRQILGVDYNEIDLNTIQLIDAHEIGDYLEFYEKYGYVDFSAGNKVLIDNHIADTTSNPHNIKSYPTQVWTDVASSRMDGTAYQNTTGDAIVVNISVDATTVGDIFQFDVSTDGTTWVTLFYEAATVVGFIHQVSYIVPDTHWYQISIGGTALITTWTELR
jgi:hypothetical protein